MEGLESLEEEELVEGLPGEAEMIIPKGKLPQIW